MEGNFLIYSYVIQIYLVRQVEGIVLLSITAALSNPSSFRQMTLARPYLISEVERVREIGYCSWNECKSNAVNLSSHMSRKMH